MDGKKNLYSLDVPSTTTMLSSGYSFSSSGSAQSKQSRNGPILHTEYINSYRGDFGARVAESDGERVETAGENRAPSLLLR